MLRAHSQVAALNTKAQIFLLDVGRVLNPQAASRSTMHNQGLRVHEKIQFPQRWIHMALQKGRILGGIAGLGCMPEPCCTPQASLSWLGCVFPSPSAVLTTLQDHAHIVTRERVAGH